MLSPSEVWAAGEVGRPRLRKPRIWNSFPALPPTALSLSVFIRKMGQMAPASHKLLGQSDTVTIVPRIHYAKSVKRVFQMPSLVTISEPINHLQ